MLADSLRFDKAPPFCLWVVGVMLTRNPEPAFGLPVGEQGIPQVYKVEEMRCDGTKTREYVSLSLLFTGNRLTS